MEKETDSHKIPRRELLKSIKYAALYAFVIGAGFEGLSLIQRGKMNAQVSEAEAEAKRALESGMPLETRYFAKDIFKTGFMINKINNDWRNEKLALGFFAGNASLEYIVGNTSNRNKGIVGVSAMGVNRVVDTASTMTFSKYMQDPKFKEYGLDAYLKEQSPLSSANPNEIDALKLGALTSSVLVGASWFFPELGEGFLGMTPVSLNANTEGVSLIKKCIELGDGVNTIINEKGTPSDVKEFLDNEVSYHRSLKRIAATVPTR